MTGKNYSIGSLWRRWDLHIHTPETKKNDNFDGATIDEKWDNYINDINKHSAEISVIAVTDYLCTDNYFKFIDYYKKGKFTKSFDLILPNVELRISPVTASSIPINIHCIFNPQFESKIHNRFFQNLYFEFSGRRFKATRDDLIDLGKTHSNNPSMPNNTALQAGILQFVVPFHVLKEIFEKDEELKKNTIIIVANGKDGVSGLHKHYDYFEGKQVSALDATRQNIYKFSDCIFSSNDGDSKYFLGKKTDAKNKIIDDEDEVKRKCGSLKPCFHGCDAHENKKIFNPDNNQFCWVKADPTFEGLKQVIYEPSERVKVQENNPEKDFDKPIFTSIEIKSNIKILNDSNSELTFSPIIFPLNRNLVSIIGGRGQGKSMLVNYLGHGLGKEINQSLASKINLDNNFNISWEQNSEADTKTYSLNSQVNLPFTFIYQSKVKEIAESSENLKKEILEMLEGAGFKKPQSAVNEFEIKEKFQNYWNILDWLDRIDERNNKINDEKFVKTKIDEIQDNIDLVTEGSNKKLLEDYVQNINTINEKESKLRKLKELRSDIISFRDQLNDQIKNFDNISNIDTETQQREIIVEFRKISKEIIEFEQKNKTIKEDNFKDFKGDLSQLLNNLTGYQESKNTLEEKLSSIKNKKKELIDVKISLNEIIQHQKNTLLIEGHFINTVWKDKIFDNTERGQRENELIKNILADKEISIEGITFFNINQFIKIAENYIDGRALRPKSKEKILELLEINPRNISHDVLNYTIEKIEKIKHNNSNCFYNGIDSDIFQIFVDPEIKNKYVYVIPDITIGGKSINNLSAGQKGTVYLCLKLATQLFSGPIIFDQPEDDLDNDFITNHLIELFKKIKEYRQVIIVSHNANLVVNSDSEQVIIAINEDENLSYNTGALENNDINLEICRILEGGEKAFEKRRDKYRYVK
ncbi:hypothetical protein SLW70_12330 [Flavobacterium sp. NG2]|uniref:TrlF family AAA-like ATPase n=1 Tax=Flavobacterium sp. NG2 TaxID=3097547 RepID=UPI002A832BC1|nr:hypothetical protein [Flavobacterium sp. NG2]WPR70716.1 hypothetical protein SLW70_12330 [Flavobacterium sp. NG2]